MKETILLAAFIEILVILVMLAWGGFPGSFDEIKKPVRVLLIILGITILAYALSALLG